MMIKKLSLAAAAMGTALLASSLVFADGHGTFKKAWDEANSMRKEAATLGHEWRDVGKMLKQAAAAQKDGKEDKAMELVAQALEQSKDGIEQHKREAKIWMNRVPQ